MRRSPAKHTLQRFEHGVVGRWPPSGYPQSLRLLFLVVAARLCLAVLPADVHAAASDRPDVLVLHSYHQGYSWTDNITSGILEVFDERGIETHLFLEYMDTKRQDPAIISSLLPGLFARKYAGRQLDVIITADNNAFEFILAHGDELFPGSPTVFCGVNRFEEARIEGRTDITGLAEYTAVEQTIDLALALHPRTRTIAIVSDRTVTGLACREILEDIEPLYTDMVEFVDLSDSTFGELGASLRGLPQDAIVLLISFYVDREGRHADVDEFVPLVAGSSPVPVYSLWDHYLDLGVVGGVMASGRTQGREAAEMAVSILQGRSVSALPVQRDTFTALMFDYRQMVRFGIPRASIPEGAVVVNVPVPYYEVHQILIGTTCAILLGLTAAVLILATNIRKRKRAETRLLESRQRLRDLGAELARAEQRERRELAAYLHDEVGQSLAAAKMHLAAAHAGLDSEDALESVKAVRTQLDAAIRATRSMTFDFGSPILFELGLNAAIEDLAERFERESAVPCTFAGDVGAERVAEEVSVLLFKALRELLLNIRKYARATHVYITLGCSDAEVVVEVADDGVGFEVPEDGLRVSPSGGFGLFNISERIRYLGGRLEVDSRPGAGTRVRLIAPLHSAGDQP